MDEREHCENVLDDLFDTQDILVTPPNMHTATLLVDLLMRERAAAIEASPEVKRLKSEVKRLETKLKQTEKELQAHRDHY